MNKLVSVLVLVTALFHSPAWAALGKGDTVLITGANRGIGLEMARQLTARGVNVIGTARKPAEAGELKALGARVEQLDVIDERSVAALAQRLEGVAIDVLINNAGVGGLRASSIEGVDFNDMAFTFNVNSIGPMRVTQALLENLRAGETRQVVNVSSVLGSIEMNSGTMYAYRASKTALNSLNKTLSVELGPQGFTCVVVHPGWVKTRMGGEAAPVEVEDSVAGLIAVIDGLTPDSNGRFIDFQGEDLPW
jgi:NAD(P)-dependent dehydrogenase (short-subunit alcohol dehydrogenase family)